MSKSSLKVKQATLLLDNTRPTQSPNHNLFNSDHPYHEDSDSFDSDSAAMFTRQPRNPFDFQRALHNYHHSKQTPSFDIQPDRIHHSSQPQEVISKAKKLQQKIMDRLPKKSPFLVKELWSKKYQERVLESSKMNEHIQQIKANKIKNQIAKTSSTQPSTASPLPHIKQASLFQGIRKFCLNEKMSSQASISSQATSSALRLAEHRRFLQQENSKFRKLITDCDMAQNNALTHSQPIIAPSENKFQAIREHIKTRNMEQELKRYFTSKTLQSQQSQGEISGLPCGLKVVEQQRRKEERHDQNLREFYRRQSLMLPEKRD